MELWEAKTGKKLHTLNGHSDWVRSSQFSPDGALRAFVHRRVPHRQIFPAEGSNLELGYDTASEKVLDGQELKFVVHLRQIPHMRGTNLESYGV